MKEGGKTYGYQGQSIPNRVSTRVLMWDYDWYFQETALRPGSTSIYKKI